MIKKIIYIFWPVALLLTVLLPDKLYTASGSSTPGAIYHGPRDLPYIVLTFDACQNNRQAGYDKRIVDILIDTKTPATFFLGGKWMEAHPDQTKFLSTIPYFELENHSYSHPMFTSLSKQMIHEEINHTQDILFRLTGKKGKFFRAPYGKYNKSVIETAESLGLKTIQWDVVSADPDPNENENRIIKTVLKQSKNGSIIIMHVNGRGWHTHKALPAIIMQLRKNGFQFVSLSKLLERNDR